MKLFAQLFLDLDRTNKTNDKVALLKNYFLNASGPDKIWALALFTGRRPSFKVNSTQVQQWAAAEAEIPDWLFRESYNSVGDLGETISLILPRYASSSSEKSLSEWFDYLSLLPKLNEEEKRNHILNAWKQLNRHETFVFNKLLMLIYLFLIIIILAAVYCFKLAAVYTDGGFAQQLSIAEKLYVQPEHAL